MRERLPSGTGEGPVELEPSSEVTNLAVFAFEQWSADRFTVTGGLRLDHRQQEAAPNDRTEQPELLERSFTEVTGAVGGNVRLTEGLALASNANVGFRAPIGVSVHSQIPCQISPRS